MFYLMSFLLGYWLLLLLIQGEPTPHCLLYNPFETVILKHVCLADVNFKGVFMIPTRQTFCVLYLRSLTPAANDLDLFHVGSLQTVSHWWREGRSPVASSPRVLWLWCRMLQCFLKWICFRFFKTLLLHETL